MGAGEFTGQQSHQLHGVPRGTTLVSDTALAVCVQNLASWKNQFLFFDRVPGAGSVEDPLLREQENDSFASELPHLLVAFSGRFTYLTHAIASGTVSFTDAPPHPWLQWAKEQHSRAWGSHLDEKPGGDQIIRVCFFFLSLFSLLPPGAHLHWEVPPAFSQCFSFCMSMYTVRNLCVSSSCHRASFSISVYLSLSLSPLPTRAWRRWWPSWTTNAVCAWSPSCTFSPRMPTGLCLDLTGLP